MSLVRWCRVHGPVIRLCCCNSDNGGRGSGWTVIFLWPMTNVSSNRSLSSSTGAAATVVDVVKNTHVVIRI